MSFIMLTGDTVVDEQLKLVRDNSLHQLQQSWNVGYWSVVLMCTEVPTVCQ